MRPPPWHEALPATARTAGDLTTEALPATARTAGDLTDETAPCARPGMEIFFFAGAFGAVTFPRDTGADGRDDRFVPADALGAAEARR